MLGLNRPSTGERQAVRTSTSRRSEIYGQLRWCLPSQQNAKRPPLGIMLKLHFQFAVQVLVFPATPQGT